MVLSGCRPEAAAAWARRGIAPLVVAPFNGWTLVLPAGRAAARPPYDDGVRLLASRPVGLRMRPSLGFFQIGRQAVMTVHGERWRAVQRWVVWTPREALVPIADLAPARPIDLITAAGTLGADEVDHAELALRNVLRDGGADASGVLAAAMGILGLPGLEVLSGATDPLTLPGAVLVVPKPRHARTFERLLSEQVAEQEEEKDV